MNNKQHLARSLPPSKELSPNLHNTMEVYITEYSTFNYVSRVQSPFSEFKYFRMVEKFSPFEGIQRFTTLDYFPGWLNLIHNLLLLLLVHTWKLQRATHSHTTALQYSVGCRPVHQLLQCNWYWPPLCSNQFQVERNAVHYIPMYAHISKTGVFPWGFQTKIWRIFLISLIHGVYLNSLIYTAHALK